MNHTLLDPLATELWVVEIRTPAHAHPLSPQTANRRLKP
jgi:hypothetical protein